MSDIKQQQQLNYQTNSNINNQYIPKPQYTSEALGSHKKQQRFANSQVYVHGFMSGDKYQQTAPFQQQHYSQNITSTVQRQYDDIDYIKKIQELEELHNRAIFELRHSYEQQIQILEEQLLQKQQNIPIIREQVQSPPQVIEKIVQVPVVQKDLNDATLFKRYEAQQIEIQSWKTKYTDLERQLQGKDKDYLKLEKDTEKKLDLKKDIILKERDQYIVELSTATKKVDDYKSQIDSLKATVEQLKKELTEKIVEIQIYERKNVEIPIMKEQIVDLQEALEYWKQQSEQFQCSIKCREKDSKELREKIDKKKSKVHKLKDELKDVKKDIKKDHKQELESLNEIILSLQKQVKKQEETIDGKNQDIETWKKKTIVNDYNFEELHRANDEKLKVISTLENKINSEKNVLLVKQNQIHDIEKDYEKLLQQKDIDIYKMREMYNQVKDQVSQMENLNKNNLDSQKAQFQQQIELLNYQLNQAKHSSLQINSSSQHTLQVDENRLHQEIQDKNNQLYKLQSLVDNIQQQLTVTNEKEHNLELKLQEKEKEINEIGNRHHLEVSQINQKVNQLEQHQHKLEIDQNASNLYQQQQQQYQQQQGQQGQQYLSASYQQVPVQPVFVQTVKEVKEVPTVVQTVKEVKEVPTVLCASPTTQYVQYPTANLQSSFVSTSAPQQLQQQQQNK